MGEKAGMKRVSVRRLYGNGRQFLMRILARLHDGLVAAILCAAVFQFLASSQLYPQAMSPLHAYFRGLLFCIPVALSYYAIEKLPSLWQFLLASLLITVLAWLLLGHLGGVILGAFLCVFRSYARFSEEKKRSLFETPHLGFLLIFGAVFLYSAFQGAPGLQRITVISTVLYLLLCLGFRCIERIDEYLLLNRGMEGLPLRRIQRVAGSAALAALLISGALLIPAAALSGNVRLELPDTSGRVEFKEDDPEEKTPEGGLNFVDLGAVLGEEESSWQIPAFVSYTVYVLMVGVVAVMLFWGIYRLFRQFRASYTDSRDVVQFLGEDRPDEDEQQRVGLWRRPAFLDRAPNAVIRRKYKKVLLRKAQEPPQRWHSPAEAEAWAGVEDPTLHALYEKARYGPSPCTAADIKRLREIRR